MAGKLDKESRMAIQALTARGSSASSIARTLGVTEGAVRYHQRRQAAGAVDGCGGKERKAAGWHEAISVWLTERAGSAVNLALLHAWLVEEHGFTGSERAVQRYVAEAFPAPPRRARRRVETPPGAQAQADWAEFRGVPFVDGPRDLYALHMQLSHSRFGAVVWSESKDQLAWLHCHAEALKRIGGVPATTPRATATEAAAGWLSGWSFVSEDVRPLVRFDRGHNPLVGLSLQPQVPKKEGPREEEYEVPPVPSAPCSPFVEGRSEPGGRDPEPA
jgi:transposase